MDAKLVVITGKMSKRLVKLQLPAVLGRSREADITVAHPMISRRHCEIYEQDGLLMLRDMASLNGTMIGGRKIVLAPLLPQGEFSIGPIAFRVLYEYKGDVATAPEIMYAEPDQRTQKPHEQGNHEHGRMEESEFEEQPSFRGTIVKGTHDKLPTLPAPDLVTPAMPPVGPEHAVPDYPEPEVVESEKRQPSPWDDGNSPQLPHAVRQPQKPPHGRDVAEEDFGDFLEGLQ